MNNHIRSNGISNNNLSPSINWKPSQVTERRRKRATEKKMSKSTFCLSHAGNGRQFGILIRALSDVRRLCVLSVFEFHITNSSELRQPEILYPMRVLLPLTSPLRSDGRNPDGWKSLIILADLMTRNEMKLESNKKSFRFSLLLEFFFAKFSFFFFICCVFSILSCFIRDFSLLQHEFFMLFLFSLLQWAHTG